MSFVSDYLIATDKNESPLNYHKWCCLASLSVLAGRRFWFNLGPFQYFPNFYTILVGDPGVKKSAAMDVSKALIREVAKKLGDKETIPIAATSTTKEAITKEMGGEKYVGRRTFKNPVSGSLEEYNQLAIFATELTTFLGVAPENMIDFLTGIWTEKVYDEKYKNTGSAFFWGPYITMVACMTPQTAKGYLKHNIVTTGFARRAMFVWGSRGAPIAIPGNSPEQIEAFRRCIIFGLELQKQCGEFKFDDEARDWYIQWYEENYKILPERMPSTQGYYTTRHEFLIKCAILMSLSELGLENRIITRPILQVLEERFFKPAEANLERVFAGTGQNPNAMVSAQIVHMVEASPVPLNVKQVEMGTLDNATSVRDLRDVIDHLVFCGRLARRDVNYQRNGVGGLLGTFIATPEILSRYSDAEIAAMTLPVAKPPTVSSEGSSPGAGQQESPDSGPKVML